MKIVYTAIIAVFLYGRATVIFYLRSRLFSTIYSCLYGLYGISGCHFAKMNDFPTQIA
jgi:hypothetical protein